MHRVHRLGDGLVNFYLMVVGTDLILIDTGLPAHYRLLQAQLNAMGRRITDIAAVLITHGHLDHIGLACRVRAESGAPIWVHERDAPLLADPLHTRRFWRPERSLLRYAVRRPHGLRAPLHLARLGALHTRAVGDVMTFRDRGTLDVPGRPLAVPAPGHTAGSVTYLFPEQSVAFTGDALVTLDSVAGGTGPRLICRAFTQDSRAALASLTALADAGPDIGTVLPGHGDPWPHGLATAVAHATATGVR